MSNLQPNCCLEFDFRKVDQHAVGKWLIHDTKRRKDNQLQSLKLPCRISKLSSKMWYDMIWYDYIYMIEDFFSCVQFGKRGIWVRVSHIIPFVPAIYSSLLHVLNWFAFISQRCTYHTYLRHSIFPHLISVFKMKTMLSCYLSRSYFRIK